MNQALNTLMAGVAKQVKDIFAWSKSSGLSQKGQRRIREITRMLEKEAVDAANLQVSCGKNRMVKISEVLKSLKDIKYRTEDAMKDAADAEWLGEWAMERSECIESECGLSDDDAVGAAQNSEYVN